MRHARTRDGARAAAALGGARAAEDGGCEAVEEELRERRVVEALLLRRWPHRLWAGLRAGLWFAAAALAWKAFVALVVSG